VRFANDHGVQQVTAEWWLKPRSDDNCNHLLPSCFSMDFRHPHFTPARRRSVRQVRTRLAAVEAEMAGRGRVRHALLGKTRPEAG
jgi:hypothetical protein